LRDQQVTACFSRTILPRCSRSWLAFGCERRIVRRPFALRRAYVEPGNEEDVLEPRDRSVLPRCREPRDINISRSRSAFAAELAEAGRDSDHFLLESRRRPMRPLLKERTRPKTPAALLDGTDLTYRVLNDRTIEVAERPLAAALFTG